MYYFIMILFDAHFHTACSRLCISKPAGDGLSMSVAEGACYPGICCSVAETDWHKVLEYSACVCSGIIPCLGIHPWNAADFSDEVYGKLRMELIKVRKNGIPAGIFIGETGLDFSPSVLNGSRRENCVERAECKNTACPAGDRDCSGEEIKKQQEKVFAAQLSLSAESGTAAVIHCVRAWGKTLEMIKRYQPPVFIIHAYRGSPEITGRFAELNGYFSFGPGLMNPREIKLRTALLSAPRERILIESEGGSIEETLNAAAAVLEITKEKAMEIFNGNAEKMLRRCGIEFPCHAYVTAESPDIMHKSAHDFFAACSALSMKK